MAVAVRTEAPSQGRKRSLRNLAPGFALAALLLAGGCTRTLSVATLLDDPSRFDGKSVRIEGDVRNPVGVLGLGTYQVDDGTGTIRVVAETGGVPRLGSRVGVEGNFRSAFTIGADTFAVLVEKRRFKP